jgi:hypothetical protein
MAAFPDVPYRKGAGISVHHRTEESGSELPGGHIAQVLHFLFFQNYDKSRSPVAMHCGKVDKLL